VHILKLRKEKARQEAEIEQSQSSQTRTQESYPGELMARLLSSGMGEADVALLNKRGSETVDRRVYRIPEFISRRKQRDAGVSQTIDRSGRVVMRAKEAVVDSLTLGDWIVGNANIMQQMLEDGRLVKRKEDGAVDVSELRDYLKFMARIGELFDLGFEKSRVMRFDDECRTGRSASESWEGRSADIGLVATYLMAPQKTVAGAGRARNQPRNHRCASTSTGKVAVRGSRAALRTDAGNAAWATQRRRRTRAKAGSP
jgi:hypothetical protein